MKPLMPDDRSIPDRLDRAVEELRGIADPERRLQVANLLDEALVTARAAVAGIKRDTVNEMRGPSAGYPTIAQRLGLTKARVQQIANAPRKRYLPPMPSVTRAARSTANRGYCLLARFASPRRS